MRSAGNRSRHAVELVDVLAARDVGVVLHGAAVVGGVGQHALALAGQPLRLELERALERLGVLEPARVLLLVVRVRPLDRVAQHRDHPRIGNGRRRPGRPVRVEQVVRAALAGDDGAAELALAPPPRRLGREVRPVPAQAAVGVLVEVVHALARDRRQHLRMPEQVAVERRRAAALRADDEELGQRPPRRVQHVPAGQRLAARRDHRRRQPRVVVVGRSALAGHQPTRSSGVRSTGCSQAVAEPADAILERLHGGGDVGARPGAAAGERPAAEVRVVDVALDLEPARARVDARRTGTPRRGARRGWRRTPRSASRAGAAPGRRPRAAARGSAASARSATCTTSAATAAASARTRGSRRRPPPDGARARSCATPGKSACRNRVRIRLGGDFSTSTGRDMSQCGPHCVEQQPAVLVGDERRGLGQVRGRVEAEPARAAVAACRGGTRSAGAGPRPRCAPVPEKPRDERVLGQAAREQGRAAAVQAADEHERVLLPLHCVRPVRAPAGGGPAAARSVAGCRSGSGARIISR